MLAKSHFSLLTMTMILTLSLTGCGGKKAGSTSSQISNQYALEPFFDVNNKSTLNLELLKDLPRVVNLKENMTSVKDQDERGSCSYFSAIALVESAIKKKMKVDVNLSEEFLNNVVKSNGISAHTEAGNPFKNLNQAINKKEGFLLERDWPYQPSWFGQKSPCLDNEATDENADDQCFAHDKPPGSVLDKKIPSDNFELFYLQADSTNEIIETLAKYQDPLTISVPVNNRGWTDDGDVAYTEEMRQECKATPTLCGFHSIVLTGYDMDRKVFFFKNSWSKDWGHEGYGTISFDVVDRHVSPFSAMVELNADIELPADHQVDPIALSDFTLSSVEGLDHSVEVKITGKMENLGHHTFAASTTLVKRKSTTALNALLDEKNSEMVELTNEEQEKYKTNAVGASHRYWQDSAGSSLVWSKESPEKLTIAAEKMQIPSILKLEYATIPNLLLRTSVYVYTDDSKYKVLKRVYHPLDY